MASNDRLNLCHSKSHDFRNQHMASPNFFTDFRHYI